jgi:L,D-peptidoglycan transpeptidase YkuD (ErfK/YbiS/YcfS/YnhG family)
MQACSLLRVRARAGLRQRGWLILGHLSLPVTLGRSGIRTDKREGDGATPRGVFHPVRIWWRPDRGPRPRALLPLRRITPLDAWCEDPGDRRHYNRPVRVAPGRPGDRLWRDDHLYDLIIEIDHNTRPRLPGRGSAVFIHLARPDFGPTAGCVGLKPTALRRVIAKLGPRTKIWIQ